jgi:hypothetical protein
MLVIQDKLFLERVEYGLNPLLIGIDFQAVQRE